MNQIIIEFLETNFEAFVEAIKHHKALYHSDLSYIRGTRLTPTEYANEVIRELRKQDERRV